LIEEFKACFRNLDVSADVSDEALEQLFARADSDGSGDLNFKEFCGAYISLNFPKPPSE